MGLRVNLLCVIGFLMGVAALLATGSGSWFLDVNYWGMISVDYWGETAPLYHSFYDSYDYLFAAGSVLVVIGVMISLLSQAGGFAQLAGHLFLVISLQSSRFTDVAAFQELFLDGLWLSYIACALVILGSFVAVWFKPIRSLEVQSRGLSRSQRLLAVSPSDPSTPLRLNLVSLTGAVACGLVLFLPWFVVKDWMLFHEVEYVATYQSLAASMGDGALLVDSSTGVYFVVALAVMTSVTLAAYTTLAGILHFFASSIFIAATYATDVLGFSPIGLHMAEDVSLGAGPFILIACGAVVLLSSWWRLEVVFLASGARVIRTSGFRAAAVHTLPSEDAVRVAERPISDESPS